MRLPSSVIGLLLLPAAVAFAQDIEIQAELMNKVGTETSRKGDLISARVLSPPALKGDILDGKVNDVKSGAKLGGKSVLSLSFETLQHAGQAIPLSAEVKSISNSKGTLNADEEGRVIRGSTGNVAKALGGTGAGALIGGLSGGGKGAAIGAGVGAVASIVLIEVASDGPNIRLDPGSRVTLQAKSRSGPALASLTPEVAPAAPAAPAAPTAASTPAPAAAPAVSVQPDLKSIRVDFIPGEKLVFFDDFSDMTADAPPPHWKVRGGKVELKGRPGARQLTTLDGLTLTPNLTGIPGNFTLEAEIKFDNPGDLRAIWAFSAKSGVDSLYLLTQTMGGALNVGLYTKDQGEQLGRGLVQVDFSQPVKMALWVLGARVRLYMNGEKVIDANQVTLPELGSVNAITQLNGGSKPAIGYGMVRIAESAPDFSETIRSSGRYPAHGVRFDTGSDRIKTESAALIKSIARALQDDANLKLLIEGHTDSAGDAEQNLELSKRRAEALKNVLVTQFSVDAGRLTTAGLGATKPMDTNDTPAGRAQNRRVELVKQ